MKNKTKKSWHEKLLDSNDLPKVVEITGKMAGRWRGVENQKKLLEAEGPKIIRKGKRRVVVGA